MTSRTLFVAILFIALFTMSVRELTDPDFWWHLRTGQLIAEHAAIPHADPFSFTAAGKEWVAHEWLTELVFFKLYQLGGLSLLILASSTVVTASFALVYLRSSAKPFVAGFVVFLAALATAPTWGVRPQLLSMLLASLFLFLFDRHAAEDNINWLAPIPLLMLLWVNLHSGYAVGLVIAGAYLVSAFLRARRADGESDRAHTAPRALVTTLLLSLAAVLVNPNGARMYVYPFETLTSAAMQRYIQEWFPPEPTQLEWLPFYLLLVGTILIAIFVRARVPLAHILLFFIFAVGALKSARHIPFFAIVAAPLLAAQISAWLKYKRTTPVPPPRVWRVVNLLLLGVVAAAALVRIANVLGNQTRAEQSRFPTAALSWIRSNQPPRQLYNTYSWGGYLIWQLYPDYPVFIDGRADVYGDRFIEQYLSIYRAEPGWKSALESAGARVALLEPTAPLALALEADPAWERVFQDAVSVVFTRK